MIIVCPRCKGEGEVEVPLHFSDACKFGVHSGCHYRFCECHCHDDEK